MEENLKEPTQKEEQIATDIYDFLAGYSNTIYENEINISNSLIQQSSQMQTAFSFVIAAVFMVAPLVFEYVKYLSKAFLASCFSTITAALLFSLLFATIAQSHRKKADYPDVATMHSFAKENYQGLITSAQRNKYIVETMEKMQSSFKTINEKRRKWIHCSMVSFYTALGLCAFWFVAALIKLI